MRLASLLVMTSLLLTGFPAFAGDHQALVSVNKARAKSNFLLNCAGCHKLDATGSIGGAPTMVGVVANFLNAPGGREYLLRVPGVATTALKSDLLAEMMNWLLVEYDSKHIPANFKPFTQQEVQTMRKNPYVQEAPVIRGELLEYLKKHK